MLEREVWSALPMIPGGLPSILGALDSPSVLAGLPFDTADFGAWVSHGNPWRMQAYGANPPQIGSPLDQLLPLLDMLTVPLYQSTLHSTVL